MGYGELNCAVTYELFSHKLNHFKGENPIYKQATSTFKNPTYAGK